MAESQNESETRETESQKVQLSWPVKASGNLSKTSPVDLACPVRQDK